MVGVRMRRPVGVVAVVGLVVTGLAGCAWSDGTIQIKPTYGVEGPLPTADAEVVVDADSGQPPATLHSVSVTSLPKVERLTLEFVGSFDGYTVGYDETLPKKIKSGDLSLPGGAKAELPEGKAVLKIKVTNATQAGKPAVRAVDGLTAIAGQSIVGADDSTLTVALGTTSRLPFVVMEEAHPARLIVNVRKP